MSQVQSINPSVRTLEAPTELRALQGWIIWRYESEPGTGKQLKTPYYSNHGKRYGRQGSAEDRAKLVTFAAARDAAARRGFDGVGLALLPEWGITALDFDHCVDANGQLPKEVEEIVSRTYAEYSPSGKGVRAFVKGNLGNQKSFKDHNNDYGFEVFSTNGFVTFTGAPLPFTELLGLDDYIAPVDDRVKALANARFAGKSSGQLRDPDDFMVGNEPTLGLTSDEIVDLLKALDPSMSREGWIQVGMALHHETQGDGFDLWDQWSSTGKQYPGAEALKSQWASFDRRQGQTRQITMATVKRMAMQSASLSDKVEAAKQAPVNPDAGEQVYTDTGYDGRFVIISDLMFSSRLPPEWIIKGVLPHADLGVLYGQSGSGKSFVALDMAYAVARGEPWRGRRVRQGRVLYIAAEGGGGVATRLKAYRQHNTFYDQCPLGVMHAAPNFMSQDDISDVVKAITNAGGVDLIIVDTFAQVTPGANENAGEDMGMALKHARTIREATGAMVLLVHHSGKDASRGARGWSGIRAAADVEMEVARIEESTVRVLRVSKQKDGDDTFEWGFNLDSVLLGEDSDGDPITSLVVVPTEVPTVVAEDKGKSRYGKWENAVMDAVSVWTGGLENVSFNEFSKFAVELMPVSADGRDVRRQSIERAIKTLAKKMPDPPLAYEHGLLTFFI